MRRTARWFETASAEQIRSAQEARLRKLIRVAAARSPFYRSWFAESGMNPESIRTLDDLRRLPMLERSHLAERAEDFRTYPRCLMWSARSSGTSGIPVTAYRTPGSSIYELTALQRQWSWFGLPRNGRSAILRGDSFAEESHTVTTYEGQQRLLLSSFHLTANRLPILLAALRSFRPHTIEGWPSSITALATLLHAKGELLPVLGVVTSSEVMTELQRKFIRAVFVGPIVDHYGQTERVVMAGNCELDGYHVFPDYGIVELVPIAGRPGRCEIVGTALHNWGFPLFRYRTGDEVGSANFETCACGRTFPLIAAIGGRVEDSFAAADGHTIPQPSVILDDLLGVREAQIAQRRPGCFEIRASPGVGFDRHAVESRARRNVERIVGPGQTVTFQVMDRIPRNRLGKLKPSIVLGDVEEWWE